MVKKDWSSWWQQKKKSNTDYLVAAETGDLDLVKALLDVKCLKDLVGEINTRSQQYKWHALHKASYSGNITVIEYLMSQPKIDVNPTTSSGQNCLHLAAAKDHVRVL